MGKCVGRPFHGILRSSDASSGVAVPIFEDGSNTEYTLKDNEYLAVSSVFVVTVPGGDTHLFIGADATPGTGETLVRGNFAANGGLSDDKLRHSGSPGDSLWVVAPAGDVDVRVDGVIRTEDTGVRPSWKEADFGQS